MDYIEKLCSEAQEHFDDLLMFAKNNRDKEIHVMEKQIFEGLLKTGNALMKVYISSSGTGKMGNIIELKNGKKLKHKDTRKIIHSTIFGEVPINREYYHKATEQGVFPLDSKLNLPEKRYSYLLERFSMGVAVNESYSEVQKYINDIFGINLPQSSIQQVADKSSKYFEKYYKEKKNKQITQDDLVIVSADGKGIPMKSDKKFDKKERLARGEKNTKKKMALVGSVYNIKPEYNQENRKFKPENKKTWACLSNKERTMELLQEDVNSRTYQTDTDGKIIFLADGGKDLWGFKNKYFPTAIEILDWYHMSEYLWKAVYVFYAEDSLEAREWVKNMENKIFHGQVMNVITGIKVRITKNKIKGKKLKILQSVMRYFKNNKQRMKYHEYVEKGCPIGSGNIESACRHVVKDRMEKTGMRWSIDGAQNILSLRAIHINNDFNDYWSHYIGKERNRLYEFLPDIA